MKKPSTESWVIKMAKHRYVSRSSKRPKKSKVIIFLNVVIGFMLAIFLLVCFGMVISGSGNYYSRTFGDGYEHYEIERGNYSQLVYDYQYYGGIIGRVNKGSEEAAAVAEYADAAFRHSAYEYVGDTEKAARQKQRMEEAEASLGLYSPEAAKIDERLQ